MLVPAGDDDPVARFAAVRERLSGIRGERALGIVDGFAGFANLLPTSALVRIARQQVETVDFASSNVRGAPFPLYIAGARMEANYPVGPTGGTAWNLTLMSYDGQPRHGPQRRRRRGDGPRGAPRPHRGGVRGAHRRRRPRRRRRS